MAGADTADHQQAGRHLGPDCAEARGQSRAAAGHRGGPEDQPRVPEVRTEIGMIVYVTTFPSQAAGGEWLGPQSGDRVQPRQREGDDGGVQVEHHGAAEHDL